MNITLKQIRVFIELTKHQTLTDAAGSLFLTKAAVSVSLAELEKNLGRRLFDRINKRLVLNQEGQALIPIADEMLQRANDISVLFEESYEQTRKIKIGASDTIGNQVLPFLVSDFKKVEPRCQFDFDISNTQEICSRVASYELDIAIVESLPNIKELESIPFSSDQMCLICAPNHALANTQIHSLKQLDNNAWILREMGSGTRSFFDKNILPFLENRSDEYVFNSTEAIINSVSQNLGIACLSKLAVRHAIETKRVNKIDLPIEAKRDFWLVYHNKKYLNPLLNKFVDYCNNWQIAANFSG